MGLEGKLIDGLEVSIVACTGGSALAEKLVDIYFTLFKLILEGKLGHTSELLAAKEAKAANKGKKAEKKLAASKVTKEGSGPRTADQVDHNSLAIARV